MESRDLAIATILSSIILFSLMGPLSDMKGGGNDSRLTRPVKLVADGRSSFFDAGELPPESAFSGEGLTGAESILFGLAIDINSAGIDDLADIPGIGSRTAEAIIAYREKEGPFQDLDELVKVKGIGAKKLEMIGRYLSI